MSHLHPDCPPFTFLNWSGSLRFTADELARPRSEEELASLVRSSAAAGATVRVCGHGHSSVPLMQTKQQLISLEYLRGLIDHNGDEQTATVWAGTPLREVGEALYQAGLALHNYGDVATQYIAGAFGTGTKGTGRRLRDLSSALIQVRFVTASGEVQEWNENEHPDQLRAARVSLGTLGIFTQLKLRVLPTYDLHRQEFCTTTALCLEHLDELIEHNRNFDFYWYPRSDAVKLRLLNEPGKEQGALPYARLVKEETSPSWQALPRNRTLKFDEMEYAVPLEAGPACFLEVRDRILERHRQHVGWRVLYRTVEQDDSWLGNASGRASVTISLHQNAGLAYWPFFKDIESIFRAYGGRPHWGKKHTLGGTQLRDLYPHWDDFQLLRGRMDPQGMFLNDYLRALLGEQESSEGAVRVHEVPLHEISPKAAPEERA
ncbi:D-arabinono-1,4-lactone oxidase [Deinococcus deserti]|uniref:Putative FAD/FMN-containing dehydrogenase putative L-gulonolactone oxidase n=1 Tax=Deinococcus deserti (strain DSM 17065 / CIP 109153 / LMG 22923 / VCD115) TaxID=546414 RepID=C1D3V7_DEIDV|nr:D-arabinono-1,4-lactone oxidase [Deinococcus deserti]ACO48186.1 putative FAD/FMN-containing dehydrogenase; putative L-gulonolactone oxidase [Deinococcus deserti VCD115]